MHRGISHDEIKENKNVEELIDLAVDLIVVELKCA